MDFQKLLNIAAENQKKAQKQVTEVKRYTTRLPPPKKEKKASVDLAAIQARLNQKQEQIKQKALKEKAKTKELLQLREIKQKEKKTGKAKNSQPSNCERKPEYVDEKHEQRHQSFMKKVQNVGEKSMKDRPVSVTVSKAAPDRPKKPKKPPAVSKGPMSYEQLLALAANQQKGDPSMPQVHSEATPLKIKDPTTKQKEPKASKPDDMTLKKAAAARKLGKERKQALIKQGKEGNARSTSGEGKRPPMRNGNAPQQHRMNGKVPHDREKQGVRTGVKTTRNGINPQQHLTNGKVSKIPNGSKTQSNSTKPQTSTAKTKHSSVAPIKSTVQTSTGSANNDRLKERKMRDLQKRGHPEKLRQSRVDEHFNKKPINNRPRPPPLEQSTPKRQSKLDVYYDRAPSSSKPRPGLERRETSSGGLVPKKRPSSSAPFLFRTKRGRLLSNEESDYEDDGFIDDTPIEQDGEDVSKHIKEIFGYDKSKYAYESDYTLRNMEASFREIQQEEARTARLGMKEDLEDIRREKEENRRLAIKMAAKKKGR